MRVSEGSKRLPDSLFDLWREDGHNQDYQPRMLATHQLTVSKDLCMRLSNLHRVEFEHWAD